MTNSEDTPSTGGCLRPFMVASCVLPLYIASGTVYGQSAGMIPQLMREDSAIPVNKEQASWVGSVQAIGMFIGACTCATLSDRFGRIRMIQIAAFFLATGFAMMVGANSFMLLVMGRFIVGLGVGCNNSSTLFVSEIAPPAFRGVLLSMAPLLSSIGFVYIYSVGGYFPWKIAAGISCLLCTMVLVLTFFTYDPPVWLVRKNKIKAARKSLRRLEGLSNAEARLTELRKIADSKPETKFRLGVLTEQTVWKPFIMILLMSIFQNIGGLYIVLSYTVQLMREFQSNYDPQLITIIVGVVRLIAMSFTSCLLRRVGRKTLGAASGFCSTALLLLIYAYLKLQNELPVLHENSWIPIVLFLLFLSTMSLGIFPLPWTMPFELFPLKVRGLMCGVTFCVMYVVQFVVLKSFYVFLDNLGLKRMILMFAASAFLFGLFSITILVETHKKTLDEIEAEFANKTQKFVKRDKIGQGTFLERSERETSNFIEKIGAGNPDS